jgi:OFA family oxalate/formate antiporter-like MFS transporter
MIEHDRDVGKAQIIAAPAAPIERGVPIFYGWIVVLATFTVLLIAYGIQFSFGVFMHNISADTGWDRGTLSLPYSMYVFVYSALSFASGRLTDRYGPRRVITIGGCLFGVGVMLIGNAHALWQLYVALGVIAACGMSATYVPCNATEFDGSQFVEGWLSASPQVARASGCSCFRRSQPR